MALSLTTDATVGELVDEENALVVYHNPIDNVGDLAHHFFSRCLEANVVPYVCRVHPTAPPRPAPAPTALEARISEVWYGYVDMLRARTHMHTHTR